MGKPVLVDSDDLEAVIFGSGVIKEIESAITRRKDDPFVRPHLQRFATSHNALASALRYAKREDTDDKFLEVPDHIEAIKLRAVMAHARTGAAEFTVSIRQPGKKDKVLLSGYDPVETRKVYGWLLDRGMVELGKQQRAYVWPDGTVELFDTPHCVLRITERGRKKLAEYDAANPVAKEATHDAER